MKFLFVGDLITGASSRTGVPALGLEDLPISRLRYDGQKVVDADSFSSFYIDEFGKKHIQQIDPAWQELSCQWDDPLVNDGGWRIVDATDELKAAKAKKRKEINDAADAAMAPIESLYPKTEINSWIQQLPEAEAWHKDNNATTPYLDGLLAKRPSKTKAEVVGKIRDRAADYIPVSSSVVGQRQELDDQVDDATTVAEVEAIAVVIEV